MSDTDETDKAPDDSELGKSIDRFLSVMSVHAAKEGDRIIGCSPPCVVIVAPTEQRGASFLSNFEHKDVARVLRECAMQIDAHDTHPMDEIDHQGEVMDAFAMVESGTEPPDSTN